MESSTRYTKWKKQRSRTRLFANILIFLYGMESLGVEVTAIFYFHQNLGLSLTDAAFYYTMSGTLVCISSAFSGILFGRYVDKTRNMRFVFLLNVAIIGIGNLVYAIPYNLWWVMFGRFLCGINESLQTTVCGKIYLSFFLFFVLFLFVYECLLIIACLFISYNNLHQPLRDQIESI